MPGGRAAWRERARGLLVGLACVAITLVRCLNASLPLTTAGELGRVSATLSAGSACCAGLSLLVGSGAEGTLVIGLGWLSTLLVLGRKHLALGRQPQRGGSLIAACAVMLTLHGGSTLLEQRSSTAASGEKRPNLPELRLPGWPAGVPYDAAEASQLPHRTAWDLLRDPRLWLLVACRALLAPFAAAGGAWALLPFYFMRRFRLSPIVATIWCSAWPAGAWLALAAKKHLRRKLGHDPQQWILADVRFTPTFGPLLLIYMFLVSSNIGRIGDRGSGWRCRSAA